MDFESHFIRSIPIYSMYCTFIDLTIVMSDGPCMYCGVHMMKSMTHLTCTYVCTYEVVDVENGVSTYLYITLCCTKHFMIQPCVHFRLVIW